MTALCHRIAAALVFTVGVAVAAPASAGAPSDALRGYVDQLFGVLDDAGLKEPGRAVERQRTIRALAEKALDFNESARRALASHWDTRTPGEQTRFVRLFTDLIDQAYLGKINLDGEKIALDGEAVIGKEAIVKGRALSKSGGATPVQFSMHQDDGGQWRLYDVSFEGMSLVGTYRAQFNKIIRVSSYDELVNRLEARTRLGNEAQASTATEPVTKITAP